MSILFGMAASILPQRVLGIGAATLDRLVLVEDFPSGEGVTEMQEDCTDGGGPVATALCVLAYLGHSCLLVDQMGDDAIGKRILSDLAEHGVMTSAMKVVPGAASAEALILVRRRDGARHIVFRRSSAGEADPLEFQAEWLNGASLLHLNGRHEAMARQALVLAKTAGVRVSFDGGAGRYRESLRDLVVASDLLIVSRLFAEAFLGCQAIHEQVERLLAESVAEIVVITDGERGSWVGSRAGLRFHQPATVAEAVVDTTGCGDVYHGAFLHGWLEQWELQRCAAFASDWAAATVGGLGGRWALGRRD